MRDLVYPAAFQKSRGAFTVTFPDLPEAITSGRNRADALTHAEDCLQEAIAGRMVRKDDIPAASRPKRGRRAFQWLSTLRRSSPIPGDARKADQ